MLIIFTTTGTTTAAATFQYRKRGEGKVGGILPVEHSLPEEHSS